MASVIEGDRRRRVFLRRRRTARGSRARPGRHAHRSVGRRPGAPHPRVRTRRTEPRPVGPTTEVDARAGHDPEAGAAASRTVDFDERQVVPLGEEPDARRRNVPPADGAPSAGQERAQRVARIHRTQSSRSRGTPATVVAGHTPGEYDPPEPNPEPEPADPMTRSRIARPAVRARAGHLSAQLLEGQGPARSAPQPDRGPGPRHRPDDRAGGILRRHPPADRPRCGPPSTRSRSSSSRTTSRAASGPLPSAAKPTSTSTRYSTSSVGRSGGPSAPRRAPADAGRPPDEPEPSPARPVSLDSSRSYPRFADGIVDSWKTALTPNRPRG